MDSSTDITPDLSDITIAGSGPDHQRRVRDLLELIDVVRPAVEADGGTLHLRAVDTDSGEVTVEEEQGLAGVFRFLSPRARRPVAIPEVQMARLGRSFALNMCWFLLQNHLQGRSSLAQP